jgi:RimJ/RimL family protein N-acetyltransferase
MKSDATTHRIPKALRAKLRQPREQFRASYGLRTRPRVAFYARPRQEVIAVNNQERMELILKECTIRPWRMDDAESLAQHANNRKVSLRLRDRFPYPYTTHDAQTFLQEAVNAHPATNFCIEVNGAAVGGIGIRLGQDVNRETATLGYWLGEKFWGRGIMTEAVAALTDFCFENFRLRRISAEVFANNPVSACVLEKAGFVFEARLKNNVVKNGELLDSLLYAKTN